MNEVNVSVNFVLQHDVFESKCRKTGGKMRRYRAILSVGNQSVKGFKYFVKCINHDEMNGPFRNVSEANAAMAHPEKWCKWCEPFFRHGYPVENA